MLFASLALCEGNHLSPVDFPLKRTWVWSFGDIFDGSLNKLLNRQCSCRWFETPCYLCVITVIIPFYFQRCDHIWRPSRLESECIYGEGMAFYFPDTKCSPFIDDRVGKSMENGIRNPGGNCWDYYSCTLSYRGHRNSFVGYRIPCHEIYWHPKWQLPWLNEIMIMILFARVTCPWYKKNIYTLTTKGPY